MGFDRNSKCPSWFQNQKKRIIIFVVVIGCFLSTVQTIVLTKKLVVSSALASLYEEFSDYFVNDYSYYDDEFSMTDPYGYDYFDEFDEIDDFYNFYNSGMSFDESMTSGYNA